MQKGKIFILFFVVCFCTAGFLVLKPLPAFAAEGDLVWPQTENPSVQTDEAVGVALDGTYLYVSGRDYQSGVSYAWRIQRRNLSDGATTWTQRVDPTGYPDWGSGIAISGAYMYVVGGKGSSATDLHWAVEKRNLSDGSLVWPVSVNPSIGYDIPGRVAADASDIYIAGYDNNGSFNPGYDIQWRIEKRSQSDGSLAWAQNKNYMNLGDYANDIAVDSSGVYIVGSENFGSGTMWRMEKRSLADGSIIWEREYNFSSYADSAGGVAVDSTGVYVVGYDSVLGSTNYQWRMQKRDLSTGLTVIWDKTSNPTASYDFANSVEVDSNGAYIAGVYMNGSYYSWRIEKRSLGDGALAWEKTSAPVGYAGPYDIAVNSTGIYVVGYDSVPGNPQWRMEKREKAAAYIDIGLRAHDGSGIISIAVEPAGTLTSPLRIYDSGTTYGVVLVPTTDSNASKIRIQASSTMRAIRKL